MAAAPNVHKAYLSLGSNIGDRQKAIRRAIELLDARAGRVIKVSSLYETRPWGFRSDNLFINAVVCVLTTLTPVQLLAATQDIEREIGRTRKSTADGYTDRVIDIDILLYDEEKIDTPELKIPHPLMWQRQFVTDPLNEILP